MALSINATLTVSCEASEEQSGPTIVHSTGVENYRVQPEIIRILQESCTHEKLSDHEKGVQCTDAASHILDAFKQAGFTVTSTSTAGSRKIWLLTKISEGGANPPADTSNQGGEEEEQEQQEEEED